MATADSDIGTVWYCAYLECAGHDAPQPVGAINPACGFLSEAAREYLRDLVQIDDGENCPSPLVMAEIIAMLAPDA
jgi:hypothetical protein